MFVGVADEELPGGRTVLRQLARNADLILGFEPGVGRNLGRLVVGRRGYVSWELTTTSEPGLPRHGSRSTRSGGFGAAFECARILDAFSRLATMHPTLTVNVGVLAAGTHLKSSGSAGKKMVVSGSENSLPEQCKAIGELGGLSKSEVGAAIGYMEAVVASSLRGTTSVLKTTITHQPWAPSADQKPALELLGSVHADLGLPTVQPDDPMERGASDLNALADLDKPMIDGWGIPGGSAHTKPSPPEDLGEWADVNKGLIGATGRLALFLVRLEQQGLPRAESR